MEKENLIPPCDKNNPNDIKYPYRDRGDYDHNCNWIWEVGQDETIEEEE